MLAENWLRSLIWTDYRLAIIFTVIVPLILLLWALAQKAEAIMRLLTIYWRVSSLLTISVYLLIAAFPVGFVSGVMARILIPISLWFWADLNEEIADRSTGALTLSFNAWRWAVSAYCLVGAIATMPFLQCAISRAATSSSFCRAFLEPPLLFKEYFHPNSQSGFLGFLGMVGLIFYVGCLIYFVFFKLSKQGRSALS